MFKKDKYCIIRQAIPKDLATFVANYFSMKKQVMILVVKLDLFLLMKFY